MYCWHEMPNSQSSSSGTVLLDCPVLNYFSYAGSVLAFVPGKFFVAFPSMLLLQFILYEDFIHILTAWWSGFSCFALNDMLDWDNVAKW